jgi:hypothetical protein
VFGDLSIRFHLQNPAETHSVLHGFHSGSFWGVCRPFAVCAGGGDPATRLLQLLFHSAINPEVSLQTEELGQGHIDRSSLIS